MFGVEIVARRLTFFQNNSKNKKTNGKKRKVAASKLFHDLSKLISDNF
jgi:hypothetical protein